MTGKSHLCLLAPLALAACGGGGSGGSTPIAQADDPFAARMAEVASGQDFVTLFRLQVADPLGLSGGTAWHYALGAWREAESEQRLSSPGAFGWYPWIDFDAGYFGLIAVEELPLPGFSPSAESVALGESLRPLIEEALAGQQ